MVLVVLVVVYVNPFGPSRLLASVWSAAVHVEATESEAWILRQGRQYFEVDDFSLRIQTDLPRVPKPMPLSLDPQLHFFAIRDVPTIFVFGVSGIQVCTV